MLTNNQAFWLQFSTVIVAFISPVIAVIITIWYQNRQSHRNAQMQILIEILSFRDYVPLPWSYVAALNRIDIVFHKQKDICHKWHEYYELTDQEQVGNVPKLLKEKKVSLISAIAQHLGYKGVDQIFLQRYYQTQSSADQYLKDLHLQEIKTKYYTVGHDFLQASLDVHRANLEGYKSELENKESQNTGQ